MYSELIQFSYLLAQNNITTNHPAPWCEGWGASGTRRRHTAHFCNFSNTPTNKSERIVCDGVTHKHSVGHVKKYNTFLQK